MGGGTPGLKPADGPAACCTASSAACCAAASSLCKARSSVPAPQSGRCVAAWALCRGVSPPCVPPNNVHCKPERTAPDVSAAAAADARPPSRSDCAPATERYKTVSSWRTHRARTGYARGMHVHMHLCMCMHMHVHAHARACPAVACRGYAHGTRMTHLAVRGQRQRTIPRCRRRRTSCQGSPSQTARTETQTAPQTARTEQPRRAASARCLVAPRAPPLAATAVAARSSWQG